MILEDAKKAGQELAEKLWNVISEMDVSEQTVAFALNDMLLDVNICGEIVLAKYKANDVIAELRVLKKNAEKSLEMEKV